LARDASGLVEVGLAYRVFDFDVHQYANPEFDDMLREIILFM